MNANTYLAEFQYKFDPLIIEVKNAMNVGRFCNQSCLPTSKEVCRCRFLTSFGTFYFYNKHFFMLWFFVSFFSNQNLKSKWNRSWKGICNNFISKKIHTALCYVPHLKLSFGHVFYCIFHFPILITSKFDGKSSCFILFSSQLRICHLFLKKTVGFRFTNFSNADYF